MVNIGTNSVKALVITGFGLNCEKETACAFESAGAVAEQIHLNDILAGRRSMDEFRILAFIGGFSFGDHIGAGTVFANRVKCRMREQLEQFMDDGKLIIGICNGFQTVTRLGLVPAGKDRPFQQEVAIAENTQGVFRDDWVMLRNNPDSPCVFTRGIEMIPMPVRHGEGRFVTKDEKAMAQLQQENLITMQYADPESGEPIMEFPHNPNGSQNAVAGICDRTGRIFGLMPHPEAYLSPYNHPHWQRQKIDGVLPKRGLGQTIFDNAVSFAKREL
ncbi:MAG: phosphoribosylformylglycinamidine synthase subunit PurQ [Lentisphaeria bacterium]